MRTKTIEKIMRILNSIFALMILLGCYLSISYYYNLDKYIIIGLIAMSVLSAIENYMLRKRIKMLENNKEKEA
jgi:4-hydroxybenzoate polyprenyltransferase